MVFKIDVPPSLILGDVDEGYGPVADEFRRNFAERGEVGAACAVYQDGRKVVDLWGGYRDGRDPRAVAEDTLVTVFSTTKGVVGARPSRWPTRVASRLRRDGRRPTGRSSPATARRT